MLSDRDKKLADAWATAQGRLTGPTDDEWPVIDRAMDFSEAEPEVLWQFILHVVALRPSEKALGMLAAGPLEDLIQYHGAAFVDRVAAEAEVNPDFAALLPNVWLLASSDPVTLRFIQLGCDAFGPAV